MIQGYGKQPLVMGTQMQIRIGVLGTVIQVAIGEHGGLGVAGSSRCKHDHGRLTGIVIRDDAPVEGDIIRELFRVEDIHPIQSLRMQAGFGYQRVGLHGSQVAFQGLQRQAWAERDRDGLNPDQGKHGANGRPGRAHQHRDPVPFPQAPAGQVVGHEGNGRFHVLEKVHAIVVQHRWLMLGYLTTLVHQAANFSHGVFLPGFQLSRGTMWRRFLRVQAGHAKNRVVAQ